MTARLLSHTAQQISPLMRLRPVLICGVLLLSCLQTSPALATEHPSSFSATYKAEYSGLSVTATRSLKLLEDDSMLFTFTANHWLASIEESSHFVWQDSGRLRPLTYRYQRSGLGRDRHAELNFDWQNLTVINDVESKPWKMSIPEDALDKLSYQLQLRQDLLHDQTLTSYQIADGGRLKTYDFSLLGTEILETPLGRLNTLKVARVRKDDDRKTVIWLAVDWNNLLVKIQQTEDDGKQFEINIQSAQLDDKPVTGL